MPFGLQFVYIIQIHSRSGKTWLLLFLFFVGFFCVRVCWCLLLFLLSQVQKTLYQLRKEHRYKAVYLAKRLGVSRQQYYNIEQGKAVIYPETKVILAGIYGLSVADIKF